MDPLTIFQNTTQYSQYTEGQTQNHPQFLNSQILHSSAQALTGGIRFSPSQGSYSQFRHNSDPLGLSQSESNSSSNPFKGGTAVINPMEDYDQDAPDESDLLDAAEEEIQAKAIADYEHSQALYRDSEPIHHEDSTNQYRSTTNDSFVPDNVGGAFRLNQGSPIAKTDGQDLADIDAASSHIVTPHDQCRRPGVVGDSLNTKPGPNRVLIGENTHVCCVNCELPMEPTVPYLEHLRVCKKGVHYATISSMLCQRGVNIHENTAKQWMSDFCSWMNKELAANPRIHRTGPPHSLPSPDLFAPTAPSPNDIIAVHPSAEFLRCPSRITEPLQLALFKAYAAHQISLYTKQCLDISVKKNRLNEVLQVACGRKPSTAFALEICEYKRMRALQLQEMNKRQKTSNDSVFSRP